MDDEDDPGEAIPVPLARTVAKRETRELAPFDLDVLRGCRVVVVANGFVYRGTVVGADGEDLHLKGDLRWLVLPLASIASVTPE